MIQNQSSSNRPLPPSSIIQGNEAREQDKEAEQASDTMHLDHAVLSGEGNAAAEQGREAEECHKTSYGGRLVSYSDSESGDSVADSSRNESIDPAVSSEPLESEDSVVKT